MNFLLSFKLNTTIDEILRLIHNEDIDFGEFVKKIDEDVLLTQK